MKTKRSNINIIVAIAGKNAIGRNGDLLYRISDDMRHFRDTTMGHPIVMGRKTWESMPNGALPGRLNIVMTRKNDYSAPGALVVGSITEAINTASSHDSEIFIIGGEQIYREALPLADRIYLTHFEVENPEADTFFPTINLDEWTITDVGAIRIDPKTQIRYRFVCLTRK